MILIKKTQRFLRFMSSMKIGLSLLAVIGLLAAIGSGISTDKYYQALPFKVILGLLLLNMALCTTNQVTKFFKHGLKAEKSSQILLRQIGMMTLHAGVVFILIGGSVYSFQGESTQIKIDQGQTVDMKTIFNQTKPFMIKLDDFNIDFNADGSPSQYFSHISLVENGAVTGEKDISVNNPFEYAGIKAYQSSFGYGVELQGESNTGWKEKKTLQESEFLQIPGTDKAIRIYKYIPNFDPEYGMQSKTLRPDNPRIVYSLYQKGSLLDVGAVSFGEKVEIQPGTTVQFNGVKPFSVLTVKRDPGLSLAMAGMLMLMAGTCLTLFLKQKKTGVVQ
ncbi:MAG: cytochrome c biogenesis protein ResB [Peptococcaceae bacterium]|nr:cytochrome c biogenesis protein ResB [Peptococcaceae bacterium]